MVSHLTFLNLHTTRENSTALPWLAHLMLQPVRDRTNSSALPNFGLAHLYPHHHDKFYCAAQVRCKAGSSHPPSAIASKWQGQLFYSQVLVQGQLSCLLIVGKGPDGVSFPCPCHGTADKWQGQLSFNSHLRAAYPQPIQPGPAAVIPE